MKIDKARRNYSFEIENANERLFSLKAIQRHENDHEFKCSVEKSSFDGMFESIRISPLARQNGPSATKCS